MTIIYIEKRSFGQRGRDSCPPCMQSNLLLTKPRQPPLYSTVTQWIAYTVTWFQPFCLWLMCVSHASVQHLPWVLFKAISGDDLKLDAVKHCTDSVVLCLHLCGSDSSQCMTLRWHNYSFVFSLSILRSQWHHVDRATNPENMSKLAVNKERASVRLDGACCPLLSLPLLLSLSDASTVLLTLTLTYSAHTLMPLHS